jgi:hypothetical protein
MHLFPTFHKYQKYECHIHRKTIGIVLVSTSIITVTGCILESIPLPNISMDSTYYSLPVYKNDFGVIKGYVIGSPQISAPGTIMLAIEQRDDFTTVTTEVKLEGKYVFEDLKPRKYIIIAYFPDGKYRVMNNIQVQSNSVQSLNFKY